MAEFPDDREEIDRAFAEIVAGFHLTTDRPDPLLSEPVITESSHEQRSAETRTADPRSGDPLGGRREETAQPAAARPDADEHPDEAVQPRGGTVPRPPETEPLFRFVPLVPSAIEAVPTDRAHGRRRLDDADPEQVERFVPPPLEPLPRPDLLTALGWVGIGYAVLFVLVTAVGVRLPGWTGWLAIVGFVAALVILISRQPRHRPPGDGAVV